MDIQDMRGQYKKIIDIIKLIRKDIKILVSPGQHDAVWVGEPQPIIGEEWAPGFYEMENVTLIPNPSLVEIDGGFKILNYHGASMHGIIEEIAEIRHIFDNYAFETEILAASVRHTMHVIDCAKLGADVMTGPLSAITGLLNHPLTDIGLEKFLADYNKGNK